MHFDENIPGRPAVDENAPIWLFDSVCVLCEFSVGYTLRHEISPRICFVSIQSVRGRSIAKANGIDPDNPESFLFIENGNVYGKSDGMIALSRHLKYPAGALRHSWIVPKFMRDFAYGLIARNRYRLFGQRSSCMVPDEETRQRFVLQDQPE